MSASETSIVLEHRPFQQQLAFGQLAESQIAQWLRVARHWTILPIYDIEYDTDKGPRLYTPTGRLVAPDLLVIRGAEIKWIEAKHKSVFTWYRKSQQWETGVDARHFDDYERVAQICPWPVWLLFLHDSDGIGTVAQRKRPREPWPCPTGLYGNEISVLSICKRFGREWARGMYYWGIANLRKLASLDDIRRAVGE